MEGIAIKQYRVGALQDVALLRARGYIDTNTSPELQKVISQQIENGIVQFIVDMDKVQYVSSAGWGVFVGEIRRLQEKGGDLKISQMSNEVAEVFEMLEFNRILASYDSIEEAIDDFDFYRNLNAFQSYTPSLMTKETLNDDGNGKGEFAVETQQKEDTGEVQTSFAQKPVVKRALKSQTVDDASLPLFEKIKVIVLENPMLGTLSIKRMLYSPRFGYTKIGLFKLHSSLKRLSLNTRAKRYRYFRSR